VQCRDFCGCGGGGCPGAEHVEGEFSGREEEVPEVRGEGDVGGSKTCDEVVLGGPDSPFGSEGTVLAGGGEGDSDVREVEEVKEGLGRFIVNVEVRDGVSVGLEKSKYAFICRAV